MAMFATLGHAAGWLLVISGPFLAGSLGPAIRIQFERQPILGAVTGSVDRQFNPPPSDEEFLRAASRSLGGDPAMRFVVLRQFLAVRTDPERDVPLIGPARLRHTIYLCVVLGAGPLGMDVQVMGIDHNNFHMSAPTLAARRDDQETPKPALAIPGCAATWHFEVRRVNIEAAESDFWKPSPAEDQDIARAVLQELVKEKSAGKLRGFSLQLECDHGSVHITGCVSSPEQRKRVLECAVRTPGVLQVINEIEIRVNQVQIDHEAVRGSSTVAANGQNVFRRRFGWPNLRHRR